MKENPRRSDKKILSLEACTEPFRAVFSVGNDNQPNIGPCLTLQVNNNKVSYPLNKPVELPPEHYDLLRNLAGAGRNFYPPGIGDYDIEKDFGDYEPRISQI